MDQRLIQEVEKEALSPPPSPNRGEIMKEVSEDGSLSQKTGESTGRKCHEQVYICRETRGGRVSRQGTRAFFFKQYFAEKNRSSQQRPKTLIDTEKATSPATSPEVHRRRCFQREGKLWGLLCQIGYFSLLCQIGYFSLRSSNQKLSFWLLDLKLFFFILFMVLKCGYIEIQKNCVKLVN